MGAIKNLVLILAILTPLVGQARTFVGGVGDGGGQGIVCRNDDGSVISARLLDVEETENFFMQSLPGDDTPGTYLDLAEKWATELDGALSSTNPIWVVTDKSSTGKITMNYNLNAGSVYQHIRLQHPVLDLVQQIDKSNPVTPKSTYKIAPIGDSHPRIEPTAKNCSIEQIAIYKDGTQSVRFVGAVWEKLDKINRAALLVHEALYRTLRMLGDINSDRTRKVLAYVMGGLRMSWILDGVPHQGFLDCWTDEADPSYNFVVYPGANGAMIANFLIYDGEVMVTKTTAYLPKFPFVLPFGGQKPADTGNFVMFQDVDNPLLEKPSLTWSLVQSAPGQPIVASIEAASLVGGKNLKNVVCNSHLTTIITNADGGVGVGGL